MHAKELTYACSPRLVSFFRRSTPLLPSIARSALPPTAVSYIFKKYFRAGSRINSGRNRTSRLHRCRCSLALHYRFLTRLESPHNVGSSAKVKDSPFRGLIIYSVSARTERVLGQGSCGVVSQKNAQQSMLRVVTGSLLSSAARGIRTYRGAHATCRQVGMPTTVGTLLLFVYFVAAPGCILLRRKPAFCDNLLHP